MAEERLNFPSVNYYADGMNVTVNSQDTMLGRGMDPKPLVLDFCKPQCIYWKEKLERCEAKLEIVIKTNPTKTCLYPMRDWVTCVEACVSPRHLFSLFLMFSLLIKTEISSINLRISRNKQNDWSI